MIDITKALRRAYQLGQTYWQQADSESYKEQDKSDATRKEFEELIATSSNLVSDQTAILNWAVGQWQKEVANRPITNVHRRALDDTWRQVIRKCGGDPVELIGESHDDLLREGFKI